MNDWKKFGCMAVASVAVFALAGCERADARVQRVSARPAAVAVVASDTHATSDAEADNGPGCAESALNNDRTASRK
jgi:hypothetical protein